MQIPVVKGIIDRRILANYHIEPDVMSKVLPYPFRPKLANGYAIGGVCLIRLKNIRPRYLPLPWGIGSENAAHRIAVEWEEGGRHNEGVFIPRRDTDSKLMTLAGGSIFPGLHYHAKFSVQESGDSYSVGLVSDDGTTKVQVSGVTGTSLPDSSIFSSIDEASKFFEQGTLGYSTSQVENQFDVLELQCKNWRVVPLNIDRIESSFFEDNSLFPKGTAKFDCALLMKNIQHEWIGHKELCTVTF